MGFSKGSGDSTKSKEENEGSSGTSQEKGVADKEATPQQKALFKAWIGVEHPNDVTKK